MMEFGGESRFNANLGNGPPTTAYDQQQSPLTEQEHGSSNNNHLEAHPPTMGSNSIPPSSSPENTFPASSDAPNNTVKDGMDNGSSSTNPADSLDETHPSSANDLSGLQSHESSEGNNKVPVSTNVESHNPLQVNEQGHQDMSSNNLGTSFPQASESSNQEHIHAPSKLGSDSHIAAESSGDDIPVSSMPKLEHSHDVAEQNLEHDTNKGPEIQNPPVQVMEHPNESAATSQYVFPSHVFARNNTNVPEWSTASNESLFSIYMGNMSFTSELACFKSCELDKPGDVYIPDQPNTSSQIHQPPVPSNKFNDISQRTAEQHEEGLKVTEAKAAETMREVIMESSRTNENLNKREYSHRDSNSRHHSDGSTKSYAFKSTTGTDKNVSPKGAGEKRKSPKSEQKEVPKAVDQAPKSNPPPNSWFSCFSCCTFCY